MYKLMYMRKIGILGMNTKNFKFNEGVIWACARINEMFDQPVIANDVLAEANISDEDFKNAK